MTPTWVTAFVDLAPADHAAGTAFWAAVTGYAVSSARGPHGEFATLLPPDGDAHLRVQRLGAGRSGHHLDLHAPRPRTLADRALDLGATEVGAFDDDAVVVLRTPAGLPLCCVDGPESTRPAPVAWSGSGRSQVDQVCLDVPPSRFEAEWTFWRGLTGFDETACTGTEFRRLDGPGALRFLFQRLETDRAPGYHLDLAVDDRDAETARHLDLGARVLATPDEWTVLADPAAGTAYCLTDRTPGTWVAPSGT